MIDRLRRTLGDNRAINPDAILSARRRLNAIVARVESIDSENDLLTAVYGLEAVARLLLTKGIEI